MKKEELVTAIMAEKKGYKKKGLSSMSFKELQLILKEIKAPEEKPEAPEEKPEFVSMCGHKFDPSEAASCFTMCKKDEPEAYKLCLANFKTLDIKPKAAKKATGAGANKWQHRVGSQGALIDDIFIDGKAMTMEEICLEVSATVARVRSHLGHLKEDWLLDVQMDEKSRYFWSETHKGKGTPITGKTAYTGTKARPAFLPIANN